MAEFSKENPAAEEAKEPVLKAGLHQADEVVDRVGRHLRVEFIKLHGF